MDKELQERINQSLENLIIVSSSIDDSEEELNDMLFDVYRLIQELEEKLK